MKRRAVGVTTVQKIAQITAAAIKEKGLHPETYLRTETVEGVQIPIFIIMCDDAVSTTHGKNGVPELPVIG